VAAALLAAASSAANVKTETVDYRDGQQVLQGYFAWDDKVSGKRPAVLVIHEWKGHGDYVRMRARKLAERGYLAFACDMYGKGVYAKDHAEAAKLAGAFFGNRDAMRRRALAGLERMTAHPLCDRSRLAAIGYCFGGTSVLELARAGADLKAVVSFHGALKTPMPARPGAVRARVLVCHGGSDAGVNPDLQGFRDEMDAAGARYEIAIYGGAVHSFTVEEAGTDPSKGMAYDPVADRRSWKSMEDLLEEVFGAPNGGR
jgi:dienelactone hydrolase